MPGVTAVVDPRLPVTTQRLPSHGRAVRSGRAQWQQQAGSRLLPHASVTRSPQRWARLSSTRQARPAHARVPSTHQARPAHVRVSTAAAAPRVSTAALRRGGRLAAGGGVRLPAMMHWNPAVEADGRVVGRMARARTATAASCGALAETQQLSGTVGAVGLLREDFVWDAGVYVAASTSQQQQQRKEAEDENAATQRAPGRHLQKKNAVEEKWLDMSLMACGEAGGAAAACARTAHEWGGQRAAAALRQSMPRALQLRQACMAGDTQLVRSLLARGNDPDSRGGDGCSPLHIAAACGHEECIEALLESGAHVDASNHLGDTPLAVAASHGCVRCVGALLGARADASRQNRRGDTVLHRAALWGGRGLVGVLLQDPRCRSTRSTKNKEAKTPKQMAARPEIGRA
eukprot:COSAG01_NODE_706_length_14134_cov_6.562309_4_plen_403_part_00